MTLSHVLSPRTPAPPLLRSADDLRRAILQRGQGDALRFDTAGLDRVLRWDAPRALIEVQSGTPWLALASRLGQTVPALGECLAAGALKGSVGDAVASNAPGPDGRPVVELVEAVSLVTADGSLRRASRARDAELFALAVGGLGIFGPAYSVTLRVDALAQAAVRFRPAETLTLQDCGEAAARATTLLVPPAKLECFLADARRLLEEWRVPIAGVDVLRTLPEQDTVLRWAKQPYAAVTLRLAVSGPLGACVRGAQVCRALIDCALALGGSFPIATTRGASRAQLDTCYPELRGVLAEQSRRDPEARLCNAWHRHHRRLLDDTRVAVRWNAPQAASA
jgi:FAD/FMN-containing dehydrogenase